jgi:AraC-like DNA-binding protein
VEFPIHSHAVHIVGPGQIHQVKRELDTNGFVMLFEASVIDPHSIVASFLLDHICMGVDDLSPVYTFSSPVDQQVIGTMQDIWKESVGNDPLKSSFIMHSLVLLCIHCMRSIKREGAQAGQSGDLYTSFRRLLHKEYKTIRKVKDYANALHISEKQLNDIISERSGHTVSSLIYRQIILESKRLLNMGIAAKEVAYELQFEDPAHFSKFFKNQTGVTPSEFLKVQA